MHPHHFQHPQTFTANIISAKVCQFAALAASTTALTHLSVIVPELNVLFYIAAGGGAVWVAFLAVCLWAAKHHYRFRWFDNLGDFITAVMPTVFIAAAIGLGLYTGADLPSAVSPSTGTPVDPQPSTLTPPAQSQYQVFDHAN
ncbi:MAG: hypothetical protein ABG776_00050 [Cyanobacteria bacterium J06555_13]